MAKGASIKFTTYDESIPKLLKLLNLGAELRKYDKIVLKPWLSANPEESTPQVFLEEVLKFCIQSKNPVAEIFIAEGADNAETDDLFKSNGYRELAEKYSVSLIDLNSAETKSLENHQFLKFPSIFFPKILIESFVISLPKLVEHEETELVTSTSNMLGAFPSSEYSGFFTSRKKKLRKWPIKYAVHDINIAKFPDFAVIDASENGAIFAGLPLELDKQAIKFLGRDWQRIQHIKLLDETFGE